MNNDLKPLFTKLDNTFKLVSESEDLNDLKGLYIQFELIRDEIVESIQKRSVDEEMIERQLNEFDLFENRMFAKYGGVPVFDDKISDEEMENIFEEYSAYFQRYGCLVFSDIVSWDNKSILIEDEIGTLDIIMRPDLLMK